MPTLFGRERDIGGHKLEMDMETLDIKRGGSGLLMWIFERPGWNDELIFFFTTMSYSCSIGQQLGCALDNYDITSCTMLCWYWVSQSFGVYYLAINWTLFELPRFSLVVYVYSTCALSYLEFFLRFVNGLFWRRELFVGWPWKAPQFENSPCSGFANACR